MSIKIRVHFEVSATRSVPVTVRRHLCIGLFICLVSVFYLIRVSTWMHVDRCIECGLYKNKIIHFIPYQRINITNRTEMSLIHAPNRWWWKGYIYEPSQPGPPVQSAFFPKLQNPSFNRRVPFYGKYIFFVLFRAQTINNLVLDPCRRNFPGDKNGSC